MSNANERHCEAMVHVEHALSARRSGDHERAQPLFATALQLEIEAVELVTTQPSRAILLRSAAWLALETGDVSEAERLAACGLADGDVPLRVQAELRAVIDEARLRMASLDANVPGSR